MARDLLQGPETDEMLLFHYTKPDTLKLILDNGTLRLSPYAATNDPRETKEWVAEVLLAAGGVSVDSLTEADEVGATVDVALRRGARLACFTLDRSPREEAPAGSLYHRGWARANMWSHYAQGHTGACLVFRRDELVGQVHDHRPAGNGDVFSCGRVTYADKPLGVPLDMGAVKEHGVEAVLDEYQTRRGVADYLYFTKNSDWASEQEFRIVVVRWNPRRAEWDEPLDVPFGESLLAVVLGDRFDPAALDHVKHRLGMLGVDTLQCRWSRGAPTLEAV